MKPEDGQKIIDEWLHNLPSDIETFYSFLSENVKKFQTFDLLSYFSYYNHLHNAEEYSDFRGDKSFFASEVLALLCLKNEFVNESSVSVEDYMELIIELQKTVLNYCGRNDVLESKKKLRGENIISDVASLLSSEAKQIRNPGFPDHHFMFTEKLFEPIKNEIKSMLGFSIADSVTIRQLLPDLINRKCESAIAEAVRNSEKYTKEIIKYRKTREVEVESVFTKLQLEEYSLLPDKQIKLGLQNHFMNELFYTFSNTYTFTAEELAAFTDVELQAVKALLYSFSCSFPCLKPDDKIYESVTILKTKPIIEHNGQFLIPSFPLMTWAVEEVVEAAIKKNQKLNDKYAKIKHEFLLKQGLEFFKTLLPTASLIESNLFYNVNNRRCETDGLIIYDKVLFIIEAKGNRLTQKAKSGHELKTQDHLEDIVRDSYTQGIRTLNYILQNDRAEFKHKNGKKLELSKNDFDDIIIVSLTLEPVGNLAMSIKATNDIGYFKDGHFPWIISIYDLVVLVDLFENPIMLIHYIKRRKIFLSSNLLSAYEELDLVSYFLFNGLYVENILKEANEKKVRWIEYSPNTDAINDYYMFKFGHKTKFTEKPKSYISKEFNDFLLQLDRSRVPHRVRIALLLLEFSDKSIKQLMDMVKKTKKSFAKDQGLHDCSVYTHSLDGLGITFMTGTNSNELSYQLNQYCDYKLQQLNSNTWIGLGDTSTNRKIYNFQSIYFAMRNQIEPA